MKFHVFILQGDGALTGTTVRHTEKIFADAACHETISYFDRVVRAKLSNDPATTGKFVTPIDREGRYLLDWIQIEPTSAMATIFIERRMAAWSLYLMGFEPHLDAAVINSIVPVLDDLFEDVDANRASRTPDTGFFRISFKICVFGVDVSFEVDILYHIDKQGVD